MNEVLKTIHKLHTTHGNFTPREVTKEDLQAILKASVRASNASARQSYAIITIDDKSVMKDYLGYVGSKALLFCVDFTRLTDIAAYLSLPYECGGILDFITASTDTALAAQTAAIAAQSLGIDYLFTNSVHRGNMKKLHDKFKLPEEHCFPLIALILGYSDKEDEPARGRLDGLGIIHENEYSRLDSDKLHQIIEEYDKPEKRMGVIFYNHDAKQTYKRYMDWFYRVWCTPNSELHRHNSMDITNLLSEIDFLDQEGNETHR